MIDSPPVRALRAALYRRMERPEHGDQDLQAWRNRLLNGLCAAAFWLGLLAMVPSMWAAAEQGRMPLVATDVVALTGIDAASKVQQLLGWLHSRGVHMDSLDEDSVGVALGWYLG